MALCRKGFFNFTINAEQITTTENGLRKYLYRGRKQYCNHYNQ